MDKSISAIAKNPEQCSLATILDQVAQAGMPAVAMAHCSASETFTLSSGTISVEDSDAITGDTHFGLACFARIFVALAVLQLCEDRTMDLDAPLSEYIHYPGSHDRLHGMTIRHLLSHTGGYRGFPRDSGNFWEMTEDEALSAFLALPKFFPTGEVFSDEPIDYALLGVAVRNITKKDIFSHVAEKIFFPLKIGFGDCGSETARASSLVRGHVFESEGRKFKPYNGGWATQFWAPAASNLSMTLRDIARLGRALVPGTRKTNTSVFSHSLLQTFYTPQFVFPDMISTKYYPDWAFGTLGLGSIRFRNSRPGMVTNGRGQSLAWLYLDEIDTSIAIGFSATSSALRTSLVSAITNSLLDPSSSPVARFSPPPPTIPFERFLAGFNPSELAGFYLGSNSAPVRIVASGDQLNISVPDQKLIQIRPLQRNRLLIQSPNAIPIGFSRTSAGEPVLLHGSSAFRQLPTLHAATGGGGL